jgi:tRNA dimethylallyltransferase
MNSICFLPEHLKQLHALGLPHPNDWHQHYDAVMITGPTASGKSALSLAISSLQSCGIISIDSALVYKGMDIGTAKPSLAEQAIVPHYLLDLIEPTQSYSVAQFLSDTERAVLDCRAQGRLPVLVGGTMMYVNALYAGLNDLPAVDTSYRAIIEARAKLEGWGSLHAELMRLDPVTAARLAPQDAQRIERALAVVWSTGVPLSHWLANAKPSQPLIALNNANNLNNVNNPKALINRCLHLSIEPEKYVLWRRIEQRFDAMLSQGFVEEVRGLMARGDLLPDMPSMRCVGYRQAWQHLEYMQYMAQDATKIVEQSDQTIQPYDLTMLRERGVIATRQLAKRQMTWLRNMPQRFVLN